MKRTIHVFFALTLFVLGACGSDAEGQVWFSCDCETSCNGVGDTITDPQFECGPSTVAQADEFTMLAHGIASASLQSAVDSGAAPQCAAPEGYLVLCQCRSTTDSCD